MASQVIIPLSIVAEANKSSLGSAQSGAHPWHTYAGKWEPRTRALQHQQGDGGRSTQTACDDAAGHCRIQQWSVWGGGRVDGQWTRHKMSATSFVKINFLT